MTAQEKINQLANAALRAAPPTRSLPKPATYMAPFEKPKPRTAAPVAAAAPAEAPPAAAPVVDAAVATPAEAPAKPFVDKADPELRDMIEAREGRLNRRRSRQSLAVSLAAVALVVGAGIFYSVSPKAQASVAKLVPAFKQSVNDVKMLGSMTSQYDESLEQIAVRGSQLDEATRAIGVDPATVSAEQNQELDDEMKKMMGEDAVTSGDRNKLLQEKFGFVEKLVGAETPAPVVAH